MPIRIRHVLEPARLRVQRLAGDPRTRRWGLRLLIAVLVYGLLGGFVAPRLLRSTIEQQLAQTLHRAAHLDALTLNPYTLVVEARGLQIEEAAGSEPAAAAPAPFLRLEQLRLRLSWSSLPRLKPIIAELLVDGLRVNLERRAPEVFNVSDLLTTLAAPADAPAESSRPLQFAISNIRLEHAQIRFDDRVRNEQHAIEDLRVGIPFLANLPSQVDIDVQPLLEARIDGSPFSLSGDTRPFSARLDSRLRLRFSGLELPKLLAYSPQPLPVRVDRARLSTDLELRFARVDSQPQLALSGRVDLEDLAVQWPDGAPLLEAKAIRLVAEDVQPLVPSAILGELRIEQPVLSLSRAADGQLSLARLGSGTAAAAPEPASEAAPEAASAREWPAITLRHLGLADGRIRFRDEAIGKTAASYELAALALDADAISTRDAAPLQAQLSGQLAQGGAFRLEVSAVLPARRGSAELKLDALALSAFQPYLATRLNARLASGLLDAALKLEVDAAEPQTPQLRLRDSRLSLRTLKLLPTLPGLAPLALARADLEIESVDLARRQAAITALNLDGLALGLQREPDGRLDLTRLLPASAAPATARRTAPSPAWSWRVASARLTGASLDFTDRAARQPVRLALSELALRLGPLSDDLHRGIPLELGGRWLRKGQFSAQGTLTPEPLQLAATLKASALDLAPLSPYLTAGINASIGSLQASLSGSASLRRAASGLEAGYQGELALANLRVIDPQTLDGFLGFGTLTLARLEAHSGADGMRVGIGSLALDRFFAQVLLDASGQLNIGRVLAARASPEVAQPAPDAGADAAPRPVPPAAPALQLQVDEIRLGAGSLDYTDNFIKPNFRANLTDIGGRIGRIASAQTEDSPVDIRARLNGSGDVAISGGINPLAATPALDLTARASEIELTRFATYSTKYTGYPIVKGKLKVDLHYALREGALNANNHIFIDQLTFGDRVDSASATNLPVRLAISLLKNRRGEIDLELPVSGSLSDPQFNVGRLVWSAFVNLIGKAVTSPFSLLAGAFGGGSAADDLGSIAFEPGSAQLEGSEQAKLARIAEALVDKPGVRLELIGRVDAASDAPALRQAAVLRLLQQQKRKALAGRAGADDELPAIAADEYEKYLARAYAAADIPKPRNALGITKTLPAAEMAMRLADAATVGDAELRALAEARAAAVQQALSAQVSPGRLFLVAPSLEAGEGARPGARVDFSVKD